MLFYPQEKLALFIDGANLYSAAKNLGFDIDYRKLLEVGDRLRSVQREKSEIEDRWLALAEEIHD